MTLLTLLFTTHHRDPYAAISKITRCSEVQDANCLKGIQGCPWSIWNYFRGSETEDTINVFKNDFDIDFLDDFTYIVNC